MEYRLDVVAVRVQRKGGVVARVVGPLAPGAVVAPAMRQRRAVEGIHHLAVLRLEGEVVPPREVAIGGGAAVPIRTLRNISLNPNFGGEVMVVSLGCEKPQPERLMPPGAIALVDQRTLQEAPLDVVCLQDEAHVGFMSMVDSILRQADEHLKRLNARRRETVPANVPVAAARHRAGAAPCGPGHQGRRDHGRLSQPPRSHKRTASTATAATPVGVGGCFASVLIAAGAC